MTYAQSSYTPGQCTWYVAGTNRWIPPGLGNAAQWLMNAPAKGLLVGKTPVPGAVAVLEPGTPGLNVSVDGHVMDVIAVSGDSVVVRDMNWNYRPFQTATHTLAADSISGYIYPPDGVAPSTSIAASDLGYSPARGSIGYNPATGKYTPGTTKLDLNPMDAVGGIISGLATPIAKAGEILIGFIAVLAGMFILVKHSSTGQSVINVVSQTAKTGAKLATL